MRNSHVQGWCGIVLSYRKHKELLCFDYNICCSLPVHAQVAPQTCEAEDPWPSPFPFWNNIAPWCVSRRKNWFFFFLFNWKTELVTETWTSYLLTGIDSREWYSLNYTAFLISSISKYCNFCKYCKEESPTLSTENHVLSSLQSRLRTVV